VALDPILNKAGLTRQQVEDPASRIRVHDQIRFLSLVADALDDDLLGFHLAHAPDLREIGLFYYVLASSQTFIEALQRAASNRVLDDGIGADMPTADGPSCSAEPRAPNPSSSIE
jgi:hypothetical protein